MKRQLLSSLLCLSLLTLFITVPPAYEAQSVTDTWQVGASADDAYEYGSGTFSSTATLLQIMSWTIPTTSSYRCSGVRFSSVTIPQGATITNATLYLRAYSSYDDVNCVITGNDEDNASNFSTLQKIISEVDRPRTSENVSWVENGMGVGVDGWWGITGLTNIVQEIVDRSGWASGNAMVMLLIANTDLNASDSCCPWTYDENTTYGAKLEVTYSSAGGDFWYFNFNFEDRDSTSVDYLVDWKLYNSTQELSYQEGDLTLLDGTYTLKTFQYGWLINETSLSTATYGNSTIDILLSMEPHTSTVQSPFNYSYSVTADNGSISAIQSAVDQVEAAGGGTVYVPAGDFVFNPSFPQGVLVPGGVNIIGAGVDQTFLRETQIIPQTSTTMIKFTGTNGKPSRISGISFIGFIDNVDNETLANTAVLMSQIDNFRVDHCNFTDFTGKAIYVEDNLGSYTTKGVIDHCNIDNPYKDTIGGEWAYGVLVYARRDAGWLPITTYLGNYTDGVVYIEDCNFSRCRHQTASNGGRAWYVTRHNTFVEPRPKNYGMIDIHGSDPGGRGIESYNNTIYAASGYGSSMAWAIRGGGGVIYDNTIVDCKYGVTLAHDNQQEQYRVSELYSWDNNWSNVEFPLFDQDDYDEDVDYFLYERLYTPYPYPHPLTQENGYIAANQTFTSITVHDQTDELLNYTVQGPDNTQMIIDVPRNCTHGYLQKDGVNQTYGVNWLYYETPSPHIVINASTLSLWTLSFPAEAGGGSPPNVWQFTFDHRDWDNNIVDSEITWVLYDGGSPVGYTEGTYTLSDGTYDLKTKYKTHLINETSLPTSTYGNTTIPIYLEMKPQSWGYLAFNNTLTALTINEQTSLKLRYTVTGSGIIKQIIDVTEKPAYVSKDSVNQTEGSVWNYGSGLVVIESTLSIWEMGWSAGSSPQPLSIFTQILISAMSSILGTSILISSMLIIITKLAPPNDEALAKELRRYSAIIIGLCLVSAMLCTLGLLAYV